MAEPETSASSPSSEDHPRDGEAGVETEEHPVTPLDRVYRIQGKVVKGFGRGSRQLGTPTANLDPAAFKDVLDEKAVQGVYIGWASVDGGDIHKTVLSIGTNPHFDGEETTVESYLVHEFEEDFYGSELTLLICGYIRPMLKFNGLDELIAAIQNDIRVGCEALETQEIFRQYKEDPFFRQNRKSQL